MSVDSVITAFDSAVRTLALKIRTRKLLLYREGGKSIYVARSDAISYILNCLYQYTYIHGNRCYEQIARY